MSTEALNTDRELWRGPDEGNGDYYADSIHVTAQGGIGIDCDGHVIVMQPREWHRLATLALAQRPIEEGRRPDTATPTDGSQPDIKNPSATPLRATA